MFTRTTFWVSASLGFIMTTLIFTQNCSEVQFETLDPQASKSEAPVTPDDIAPSFDDDTSPSTSYTPPPLVICDPFAPDSECSSNSGLIGNIYYLLPNLHKSLFDNDMYNAGLDDYRQYGIKIDTPLVLTQINVTARDWEVGFSVSGGENTETIIQDENGDKLFEWFSVDVSGYIHLPDGHYQIAMISDDGMRVTIDDKVHLEHDSIHAPTIKCSSHLLSFYSDADEDKKSIRIQYFQGPRTQIAMQLLIRPIDDTSELNNCPGKDSKKWREIPAEAFSH